MQAALDLNAPTRALARIRALSRPMAVLLTIVLAVAVLIPVAQIAVILFLPVHGRPLESHLSFNGWQVGLGIGGGGGIALDALSREQRCAIAAIAAVCTACSALAVLNLRSLFVLYSRGVVFAADNIRRIKSFGMWLIAAAIAGNLSGRLFVWVTHTSTLNTANAALVVVLGAMIYVIAYVMELGREADLERKDFI